MDIMNYRNTQGFSIVEVLVSMVILSIGVLALSVLQLSSMQNTQGGHMRSQASMLAYNIVDAMRANPTGVANGNYSITFAESYEAAAAGEASVGVDCYGAEADCSAAQMAASDLDRWNTVLGAYLPSGQGQIVTVIANDSIPRATVSVQWVDPYSAEAGPEQVSLEVLIQ